MRQRWQASWRLSNGVPCTFTFDSLASRMIAHIDFKLQLLACNERVPEQYELEEIACFLESTVQERQEA
jgi:hypothetical protein